MDSSSRRNESAYYRLKSEIDERFAIGHYVAIVDDEIAGDAADFRDLLMTLQEHGHDPGNVLVVQAGVEEPKDAVILFANEDA